MGEFKWNMFDLAMVASQLFDQASQFIPNAHGHFNMSFVRILRILRVTRLFRLLRLFDELHSLVSAITSSINTLFWTSVVIGMVVYVAGVFFTLLVSEVLADAEAGEAETLQQWYGSLNRTLLTLFE